MWIKAMRCKTALKIVSLVLVLVSIISMVAPNTVTAMVSQKEYRSRLEVRNLFGVLVGYAIAGHVITIDTNQNRIVRATNCTSYRWLSWSLSYSMALEC